jgi:hypothetical protein
MPWLNCTSITFQVIGKVRNKELIVLIDGGSTYNFIEQFVVTKFGLQVVRGKTIQVTVGNKAIIECTRCCMRLSLSIQRLHIHNLSGYWEGQKQRIDSAP